MPDFKLEDAIRARMVGDNALVMGIDEVGTGALAGPVFAGAVILDPEPKKWYSRLDDSKRLRPREREALHELIIAESIAWATGWVSNKEIDQVGISTAKRRAILMAVESLRQEIGEVPLAAVVDGMNLSWMRADFGKESLFVNRADSRSLSVAAASISAKVMRDGFMRLQASRYPAYNFAGNKGYGTQQHMDALKQFGPCDIHRKSFAPIRKD